MNYSAPKSRDERMRRSDDEVSSHLLQHWNKMRVFVVSLILPLILLGSSNATECPMSEADAARYIWDPCAPVPTDFTAADMRTLVAKAEVAHSASIDDLVDELYVKIIDEIAAHANSSRGWPKTLRSPCAILLKDSRTTATEVRMHSRVC
jgi:hypothetical protein